MGILGEFKRNLDIQRANFQGKAISRARMIKSAKDVDRLKDKLDPVGPPKPIEGAAVRMLDGKIMTFHTDGSLRHALGRRVTKAVRKEMKRARRAKQAQS